MPSIKRGRNPEEAGLPPRLEKDGYLPETALCVSRKYSKKADEGGEEGCSFSPPGIGSSRKEGPLIAHSRCGHQSLNPTKAWGMAAGRKEEKKEKNKKKVPVPSAQESKAKGKTPRS